MAHPQVGSSVPAAKLSFAKIAAMAAAPVVPAVPKINKDSRSKPSANTIYVPAAGPGSSSHAAQPALAHGSANSIVSASHNDVEQVRSAIEGLGLIRTASDIEQPPRSNGTIESLQDDQSQLSNSSFKQQSFETKSIASVTTFAMDEKESIRPDDSASVRAVEEDEPHNSLGRHLDYHHEPEPPGNAARIAMRVVAPNVTIAARRYPGVALLNPPRFGDLPVDSTAEVEDADGSTPDSVNPPSESDRSRLPVLTITPDEKLLEALTSVKDRLPLLQLEERIMFFILQSREDMLELPPQNSFTRLLTHKLADYYNLAHQVSEDNTSVRIYRTSCCTLPTSLAEIAKSIPIGPPQASNAAQVKIMRRAQLGRGQFSAGNSTAASSSVPSKATSENGLETNSEEGLLSPIDSTPNRDKSKLTREEREAQYKAARERIFGDFQESVASENGSTGETSASMSRSSSSSGRKKARKQKAARDDTFEARSAFIPSYAPMHMQQGYQTPYSEMQFPGAYSSPTSNYPQNVYGPGSIQSYPGYEQGAPYGGPINHNTNPATAYGPHDGWQNMQPSQPIAPYNYQPGAPYQNQSQMLTQMNPQFQQNMPNAISMGWMGNQPQSNYPHSPASPSENQWPQYNPGPNVQNSMPYQYGQLPPQNVHATSYNNQHPVPGSYSGARSLFNPQTRSFVPNSGAGRGGGRNSRKKGGQPPNGNKSGTPSGAGSPALTIGHDVDLSRPKEDSLQQKYGTPANLPKKPPPPQGLPHFSGEPSTNTSQTLVSVGSASASGSVHLGARP